MSHSTEAEERMLAAELRPLLRDALAQLPVEQWGALGEGLPSPD